VSALMELVNELYAFSEQHTHNGLPARRTADAEVVAERPETVFAVREAVEALVLMLSPFTPHMAEELWEHLGHDGGIIAAGWPTFDPDVARADDVVIPVQVNGKVRVRLTVPIDTADDDLRAAALADPGIAAYIRDRTIHNVIVAHGRLVSIVVK
jgi:leucyl-tRNA synthetase